MTEVRSIEVRCPNGPQRLFMKLKLAGESPTVTEDNLLEFACSDCKRTLRKQGFEVDRVLHQYDFLGNWVETYLEY
jgi:DNA-directed RNA polymerase subunit RPC12/RpoP